MIGCRRKLMYFSMSSLFCLGVWGCQPGDGPNSPSATPGGTRVMDSGGAKGQDLGGLQMTNEDLGGPSSAGRKMTDMTACPDTDQTCSPSASMGGSLNTEAQSGGSTGPRGGMSTNGQDVEGGTPATSRDDDEHSGSSTETEGCDIDIDIMGAECIMDFFATLFRCYDPSGCGAAYHTETASGIRYPNGARTLTSVNYDVSGLNVSTVVTQYTSSTGENCYLFTLDRRTTPNLAIYEDGRGARLTISDTDTETVTIMCPDGSEHTVTTTVRRQIAECSNRGSDDGEVSEMSNREETAECVEPEQADNGNVGTPCNDDSVCTGDDALCCDISGPDDAESRVCASSNLCDIAAQRRAGGPIMVGCRQDSECRDNGTTCCIIANPDTGDQVGQCLAPAICAQIQANMR